MAEAGVYHKSVTPAQQAILDADVHPEDQHLVDGGMDANIVKALRHRRDEHFANDIEGPVHGGRLSRCTMMIYAPPSLTTVPLTVLISVYVIQFYEQVGASLGLLAFFQALARAFDVVTDPTMSFITDSCRHKQGRRRPFMFTGAPFYSLCLMLLMFPQPSLSEFGVSVWFGFFYIAFFLFATYCNIPYDALAPELTDNQKDRDLLFFACTMFDGFGTICAAVFPAGFGYAVNWYRAENSFRYKSCNIPGPYSYNFYGKSLDLNRDPGLIDALSSPGPWGAGARTQPPPLVRKWNATISVNESYIKTNWLIDGGAPNRTMCNANLTGMPDASSWCTCLNKADVTHGLDSMRYAYWATGMFFALWALFFFWLLVCHIKERSQLPGAKALPKPSPLMPSILTTLANKPFTLLLPSWICDQLANAIIGSLLTFFVRYIVQPEYSNQEEWGCAPVGGNPRWECSTTTVLAASVISLLMGGLIFTPLWLFLSVKLGKRTTWLLWSLSNGVTFLVYSLVGKGDVYLCVAMSVINGLPLGAKFLADSIMADVIDYDEYLTGSRSEATYTMFKGFLPKIAAIPASAIPIVLLSTVGHVPPIDSVLQPQPQSVRTFIQIVIIYIPAAFAFTAFLIKLRYPLRTDEDCDLVTEGVSLHLTGQPAEDPCSGIMYQNVDFNDHERETLDLVGSFPGVSTVQMLLDNWADGTARIKKRSMLQLIGAFVWLIVWGAITGGTAFLLMSTDPKEIELQFIPVLSIVFFGMGITLVGASALRLKAAYTLARHKFEPDTLKKELKSRKDLLALKQFPATIMGGCTTKSLRKQQGRTENQGGLELSEAK